jgi:hypothetical protein
MALCAGHVDFWTCRPLRGNGSWPKLRPENPQQHNINK